MSYTEHQSMVGGPHPEKWRRGSTCGDCETHHQQIKAESAGKPPMTNLAWLKNSNESGDTAMSMVKEFEQDARETGRDMRKVGGSQKERQERNERIFGSADTDT